MIGLVSYLSGTIAMLVLAALLLSVWRGRLGAGLLLFAVLASALWSGTITLAARPEMSGRLGFLAAAELLRGFTWLLLLWRLVVGSAGARAPAILRNIFVGAVSISLFSSLAAHIYSYGAGNNQVAQLAYIVNGFLISVAGLVLVEQYYRNSPLEQRWAIKFFCFAVGGIFVYDVYMFATGLLFLRIEGEVFEARGAVNALSVLLIGISVRRSKPEAAEEFTSRGLVFYSTGLLGVGIYLLVMAAGGYALRIYGGTWGAFAQILFLSGALVVLAAVLMSGQARAQVKVFLDKHFFNYRYDYRNEWLSLTRKLSQTDDDNALPLRAIECVAELVESPAGALWLRNGASFELAETWNMRLDDPPREPVASHFSLFLTERKWIVDLAEFETAPEVYGTLDMPPWLLGIESAWLVVPLLQADELLGFVVLAQARAMRELTWEDHDLLKTAGRQIAGHLALHESAQRLTESEQFLAYNRLTAFIMHDLKNIVAQQSLVVRNAARHKDNPEFIDDVIATVDNSVKRMNGLLEQLRAGDSGRSGRVAHLREAIATALERNSRRQPQPGCEGEVPDVRVQADPEGLSMVLGHLVRNAQEATGRAGKVSVRAVVEGADVVIEVHDDGSGMSPRFVRERLFRPFDSTKGAKGMGIGVYQAREFMQAAGGSLSVTSSEGEGSVFYVRLPISRPLAEQAENQTTGAMR